MDLARAVDRRDVLLPLLIAVVATVEAVGYAPPALPAVLATEWAASGVLVLRRRWPWSTATLAPLLTMVPALWVLEADELAAPILVFALAGYTLARHLPDLRGLASMALFAALILGVSETSAGDPPDITDVVFVCVMLFPPYVFGLLARALAVRNARLAEQAELLSRLQATVRADAVAAERARIARELHDVIAHSVSAMVVQSAAAEDLIATDPERAAAVLHDVTDTGRRALAETGRLLHLIRDTDDELGLEPDVGLERLPELVDQFRRSGLEVDLVVDGSLDALPAGIDLSGYRIVQEALTNALKYAVGHGARLRLRRTASALQICAENPGRPLGGGAGSGSGLGLVGMAERVSVFGGTLTHGFTSDGRFVLSATLPLADA